MKSFDSNKSRIYISYLNKNNLYDWAMSQYFPYGGFKWLNQKEADKFHVDSISENSFDEC